VSIQVVMADTVFDEERIHLPARSRLLCVRFVCSASVFFAERILSSSNKFPIDLGDYFATSLAADNLLIGISKIRDKQRAVELHTFVANDYLHASEQGLASTQLLLSYVYV
jgi:hypothetical protein